MLTSHGVWKRHLCFQRNVIDRLWGNTLGESKELKTHATGTSGENRFDGDWRGKRWGPSSLEQRRGV